MALFLKYCEHTWLIVLFLDEVWLCFVCLAHKKCLLSLKTCIRKIVSAIWMGFEKVYWFHRVHKRQRQKTIKGKALSATNRHYIFLGLPHATLFINALDNIPFTGNYPYEFTFLCYVKLGDTLTRYAWRSLLSHHPRPPAWC